MKKLLAMFLVISIALPFLPSVVAGSGGANDDSASCNEDSSVLINVLGNDSGLTRLGQISDPPHGTAVEESGQIRYTPDPNWNGTDTFTYTAMSAGLYFSENGHYYEYISNSGITWENAKNAAAARSYYGLTGYLVTVTSATEQAFVSSKLEGQGWMGSSDSVSENSWRWVTGPENGTLFFYGRYSSGQGSCPYSVPPTYYGYTNWASNEPNDWDCNEDYGHFYPNATWNDYPANNGAIQGYVVEYGGMPGDSPTFPQATVTVTVNAMNDSPATSNGSFSVNEDSTYNGSLPAYFDIDGGPTFTYSKTSGPSHGTTTVNSDGTFSYSPSANYFGGDSFMFQISDGNGGTASGTMTITVTEVNDPPVANDQSTSTQEDNVLTGTVTASDVDYGPFDTLIYSVFTPPIHGSLTITTNGGFTYTPDTHYNGPDSFEFLVIDQSNGVPRGGSDTGLVSITVEHVDDAPEVEILLDTSIPLRGAIEIPYLIKDNDTNPAPGVEPDKCSIIVEFFHNGQWQNATMEGRSEPMFWLDARPEGFRHSFTWDSGRDLPNQIATDIKVRIKASDGFAYGGWAEIGPFIVNNTSVVPINAVLQSAYNLRVKTVESLQSEIMEQLSTGCKDNGVSSTTCNISDEVKVLWMQAEMRMENSRNTGNTVEALNELKLAKELYEQILEILSS